jgi:RHS repeat-associated protein
MVVRWKVAIGVLFSLAIFLGFLFNYHTLFHSTIVDTAPAHLDSRILFSEDENEAESCPICSLLEARDYCVSLGYGDGYDGLCNSISPNESSQEMDGSPICCSDIRIDVSQSTSLDFSSLQLIDQTNYSTIYYNSTSDQYVARIKLSFNKTVISSLNISSFNCSLAYCVQGGLYSANFNSFSNASILLSFFYENTSVSYSAADLSYLDGFNKEIIATNTNVTVFSVNGSLIYYGIYGSGVDLYYRADQQGIKEWLIIQDQHNISSPMNLSDTTFLSSDFKMNISSPNSNYFFTSLLNETVPFRTGYSFPLTNLSNIIFLPKPYAIDSSNNSIGIEYQFEQKSDGLHLSVLTPYSWLQNATYPVMIDPGLDAFENGRGQINRFKNSVSAGRYDWDSYLNDIGSVVLSDNSLQNHGWAWFDVGSIPDNAIVQSVKSEISFFDIVDSDCHNEVPLEIGHISDSYNIDDPSDEIDQKDLWMALGDGNFYTQTYFYSTSDIGWRGFNLGSNAIGDVQALIDGSPSNRYILSFLGVDNFDDECHVSVGDTIVVVYYSLPGVTPPLWPQCNPAESCCDANGYFRPSGYVCKSAHDAVCDNPTTCSGRAFEDRCTGDSAACLNTNNEIFYNAACNEMICESQSCSGSTFQPQRTCNAGTCQTNNAFACSNNLNCLDATSCKKQPSSNTDCASGFVFDAADGVCWTNDEASRSLLYDANGNLLNSNDFSYKYDSLNQLVNVSQDGSLLARYFYDDQGTRVKKVQYEGSGNETTYYFDNFVQIVNASGTYNETYYYYYDKMVGKKDSSGIVSYYHPDALGSTTLITDSSGVKKAVLNYDPYGQLAPESENSAERYTFTGQEHDSETDLLYMKARYHNPDMAQFTQPDSIVQDMYNPQDLNKYAYARNNPYKYKDASGNYVETAIDLAFIGYDINQLNNDPRSITNWLALGGDVVGAALPFATGIGEGVRIASKLGKIDEVADALKATRELTKSEDLAKPFTKNNFRENVLRQTGESGIGTEAHHNLPQQFKDKFEAAGIKIHDPIFGSIVEKTQHRSTARAFNQDFKGFFKDFPRATRDQILNQARDISRRFGFNPRF